MGTLANERKIYIIGPRKLQNEILALYIEKELKTKCMISVDTHYGPPEADGLEPQALVLLDSPQKNLEKYFVGFDSENRKTLNGHIVALFNVRPGLEIEASALYWGVKGVFYETDTSEHFIEGMYALLRGEMWYPREVLTQYILSGKNRSRAHRGDDTLLTQREREILFMVVKGMKNIAIANQLYISAHTVKTHLYNIFQKINVPNRLQAALWAEKNLKGASIAIARHAA